MRQEGVDVRQESAVVLRESAVVRQESVEVSLDSAESAAAAEVGEEVELAPTDDAKAEPESGPPDDE